MIFCKPHTDESFKVTISIVIIFLISFLFSYKYLSKFTSYGLLLSIILLFIQITAIIILFKSLSLRQFIEKRFNIIVLYSILLMVIFTIIIHFLIDVNSINVDRWSVIESFWQAVFSGDYPYAARSNMDNLPGPMPVYFLISLPFYLTGEQAILSASGFVLLFISIKDNSNNVNYSFIILLLTLTSLFTYWEIAVRSNIFTFSILITAILIYFDSIDKNRYDKRFILSAVLTGLLLSTRIVFALVYLIYYISLVIEGKAKLKSIILYFAISAIIFLLTFLPFILLYGNSFWKDNPFITQSSLLNSDILVYVYILLSLIFSLISKNKNDRFFFIGITLFLITAIYFIIQIFSFGLDTYIHSSVIDISYFLFCLPFLFIYLLQTGRDIKLSEIKH